MNDVIITPPHRPTQASFETRRHAVLQEIIWATAGVDLPKLLATPAIGPDARRQIARAIVHRAWLNSHAGLQAMAIETLPPVPAWVAEMCRKPTQPVADSQAPVVEPDQPANAAWAVHYLKNDAPIAIEGRGGELTTLARVAGVLKDHGISEDTALQLMLDHWNDRCEPPWEFEELKVKVHNAYLYCKQSAPGADTAESDFAGPSEYDDLPVTAAPPKLTRSQQRKNYQQRKRRARAAAFVD
jgi:hypothetical protein